ncbi:uncharacterized protein EV154DRAFT_481866 [Mucor mucedo]|uniref:uncharacterized protein n=1 Tax=Mucor mucedo TaxID=29922 RepID=UPI00221FB750|nr:uncharacterized protein EV154DRAFT_481866 [Mucor mucedo]KAI7890740.1 hypothetical protein EV154DRAFT_481866 [Mucor mucedo]
MLIFSKLRCRAFLEKPFQRSHSTTPSVKIQLCRKGYGKRPILSIIPIRNLQSLGKLTNWSFVPYESPFPEVYITCSLVKDSDSYSIIDEGTEAMKQTVFFTYGIVCGPERDKTVIF